MSSQDKFLCCADCGLPFVFTSQCPRYRAIKKTQRDGDGDHSYRSRSWK